MLNKEDFGLSDDYSFVPEGTYEFIINANPYEIDGLNLNDIEILGENKFKFKLRKTNVE